MTTKDSFEVHLQLQISEFGVFSVSLSNHDLRKSPKKAQPPSPLEEVRNCQEQIRIDIMGSSTLSRVCEFDALGFVMPRRFRPRTDLCATIS